MKSHGPWKIKESADVYHDPFIHVRLDQVVRPDGNDGQHVVVGLKPGVCVLPVDDSDPENIRVHLTGEFHYGVGRYSLEGVSGGIESGEGAEQTAVRELQEELGLQARTWQLVTTVDPFTTVVVSPTQIYFATGLSEVDASPEGTEQIERVTIDLTDAVAKVVAGGITHAPTCVAVLLAARKFGV